MSYRSVCVQWGCPIGSVYAMEICGVRSGVSYNRNVLQVSVCNRTS